MDKTHFIESARFLKADLQGAESYIDNLVDMYNYTAGTELSAMYYERLTGAMDMLIRTTGVCVYLNETTKDGLPFIAEWGFVSVD